MSHLRNNFDFNLWMFCVLATEADKFAYVIKEHVRFEFKHRVNLVLQANKSLQNYISENNLIDILEDQGEWFSKALEIIMNAQDYKVKEELALILREYTLGKVDNCVDYLPKEQVIEFVQRFTTLPKEAIEQSYDNYKSTSKGT